MRNIKTKRIRELIRKNNPDLLIIIRNIYGDKTFSMEYKTMCRNVKKLYNEGNSEILKIVNERKKK